MLKDLTPQVVISGYEKHKESERGRRTMATANWPTVLAHACEAYAVYNRIVPPEKRRKIGADLAMIFSEGNDQARMVKRDLIDAGFEVSGEEEQMAWPKFQISGRRDLIISRDGFREKVRTEVKSCSQWTFEGLNSVEDLLSSNKDWIQKWWKQVALYMVLQGVEKYWMLLKSKQNGRIKIIEFKMNDTLLDAAEQMLQKAERVNRLVQLGQDPPVSSKISDMDYCSECEFFDVCLPDVAFGPGAAVLTEEQATELEEILNRREALRESKKEYDALDEDAKGLIKALALGGINKVVAGEWIATVKENECSAYTVKARTIQRIDFKKVESQK